MPTLSVPIAAHADILSVQYNNGYYDGSIGTTNGIQIYAWNWGAPFGSVQPLLLRFSDAEIADLAGATINSAVIRFRYQSGFGGDSPTRIDVRGRLLDNAPQEDGTNDPDSFDLSTAIGSWTSVPSGSAGDALDTPDLAAVITEMAAGGYLDSGVAMFYVRPILPDADPDMANDLDFWLAAYSDPSYAAPTLIVDYTAAPSSVRVTVDRSVSWDVAERVTADRALSWDVAERVTVDRDLSWAINERVTHDRSLSWHVSTADGVPGDVTAAVALAAGISAEVE